MTKPIFRKTSYEEMVDASAGDVFIIKCNKTFTHDQNVAIIKGIKGAIGADNIKHMARNGKWIPGVNCEVIDGDDE